MAAFALKTVFALFTFFAVANSHVCTYSDIIDGYLLQLYTYKGCVSKHPGDFQLIIDPRAEVDGLCVCQAVNKRVGKTVKSLVFEPGVNRPAYFNIFSEEGCQGLLPGGPFEGKMMYNLPEGHPEIKSVEICREEDDKAKKEAEAEKEAEEKKAAEKAKKEAEARDKARHSSLLGKLEHGVQHGLTDAAAIAGDLKMTKTQVEELGFSGTLGIGALEVGAAVLL
ncbi:hypothetical protein BJ138DRAFT_1116405 [Hygrophoropsis aurantiaca]|uniref:Uncharacterized protein n=1 Tax=Hygrophoropsis aurantiaca TaxID=72124 RepID=A0ACB8A558_9AGAM|nr:hypothetical protein BJ138DRAFT_1116405 [Hygrophoropsis aurantiaca]